MNKNLYMETMNKISMNENCTERIIKEAESSVNTSQYKPKRKIRFIPVMAAAAAALTCGTWAAAESGGFEWIRTFFSETSTDMEITDVETSLIGEMENFSYESSSSDISFTPIGMIADKLNIYCIVKPEGIDAEQIQFIALNSDGIDYESGYSGNLDAYEDIEFALFGFPVLYGFIVEFQVIGGDVELYHLFFSRIQFYFLEPFQLFDRTFQ